MLDENIDNSSSDQPEEKKLNQELESSKPEVEKDESELVKEEEKVEVENEASEKIVEQEEAVDEKVEAEKVEESEEVDNIEKSESVAVDEKAEEVKKPEKEIEEPKKEYPVIDYAKLSIDELVDEFENVLNDFSIKDVKNHFEDFRSNYNTKYKKIAKEELDKFIEEGGDKIDFVLALPVMLKFNSLTRDFKRKRQQYYKQIESEQKENLDKKKELIEKLKGLIDNADPGSMYKEFRELQNDWRSIGQIPRAKYNDIWQTYHHHVERFYDLLHLNKDFRDLDFKHNLEKKSKLVEKAESLAIMDDVDKAFRELQVLHRLWKEDIGPVARDHRDEIWNRFSEATKQIHHKRHEFQKQLDVKFEENIDKKIAVIEKIKAIDVEKVGSHRDWQNSIKELEKLRKEFFAIGRVPSAKNEEIWQLFKKATRDFNHAKNAFYKNVKSEQNDNLVKKMHLVEQAESLKDSEDWDVVTDIFKKVQSDWKKIGHVPKKDSDVIWKRFKDACNHFFDRLHSRQDDANVEHVESFNKKKNLISSLKEKISSGVKFTLDDINDMVAEWRKIGALPSKMHHIESKFNKALEGAYKELNIDKDEASFLKFKNFIDSYVEQNDVRKIESEQFFVRKKIDETTREIKQLENNVSFISNVSEDNPLVQNVMKNIEGHKKELEVWKKKLNYLKNLDY